MYSKKTKLDKFYTKSDVAIICLKYVNVNDYDLVIEPSAGNGSFFNNITHLQKIGIDIEPETENVLKMSWFEYSIPEMYSKVLIVGNPPFGIRNGLSKQFISHAVKFDNVQTIAFILPNVYHKHTMQKHIPKKFRLKSVYELPKNSFISNNESYHVPCSFFIFDKSQGEDLRFNPDFYKETSDWTFSSKDDYDFFVMGASINTIKDVPTKNNRGYYIKVKNGYDVDKVKNNFMSIKVKGNSSVNGGAYWITKPELVKQYMEQYTNG
jgi:hypothetical protein